MGNTSSEDDSVFRLPRRGLCCSDGVRAGVDSGGVERLRSARRGPPWNPGPVTPCICPAQDGQQSTSTFLIYVTLHPVILTGHTYYHRSTGKERNVQSHDQKKSEESPLPFCLLLWCCLLHTTLPFLRECSGQVSVSILLRFFCKEEGAA